MRSILDAFFGPWTRTSDDPIDQAFDSLAREMVVSIAVMVAVVAVLARLIL